MITHNESTVLWWLLVAASSGTVGLLTGHWRWPSRKRLDDEHDDGYECGWDDAMRRVENDRWMAEHHEEWASGGFTHRGEDDELESDFKNVPRPGDSGGRTAEGSALATMAEPITGPGRTIYPELAALADPPGEPESRAEALDPHWYARRMHELADWHVEAQRESAWFAETWLPGYLDWYRRSLEPSWSAASRMLEGI